MSNQINTQEVIQKEFFNIFEISHLFNVSGITARRYIKNILDKIDLLEDKLKLSNENDRPPILQELNALVGKARKRVVGQTQSGEALYILELSNKEAFENWELRPNIKETIPDAENLITQELNQAGAQPQQSQESGAQTQATEKAPEKIAQKVTVDAFGQKYVQLLETQLSEKDATIKD